MSARAEAEGGRLRAGVGAILVIASGALAYAPSLSVPFVLDDLPAILEEPRVRMVRLDWDSFVAAVAGFPLSRWLAYLTFALNHRVGGFDPIGFHVVNLAFHLAAALMAGLLAREVLVRAAPDPPAAARDRTALIAALLFALHPIQTQAVTYAVQRMTSMGGFFALLSLWLFLRGRRPEVARPWPHLAGAGLAAFAAFSCKENYVVLPGLAALLEWLLVPGFAERVRRHPRVAVGLVVPVAATVLGAAWRYAPFFAGGVGLSGLPMAERLLSQARILWHYLSLLALPLPSRLHVDYGWRLSTSVLDPWTTLPSILGLAALVAAAFALRRRLLLPSLAVLWFVVALSVEQSFVPLDLVAEHRLYVPSFGWMLLAAVALERGAASLGRVRWAAAAAVLVLLAAGTWQRNLVWRDPVRLFVDGEGGADRQSNGLLLAAVALKAAGRGGEAAPLLRRALALNPLNGAAMLNLAALAAAGGQPAVAEAWFLRARQTDPYSLEFWTAWGDFLLQQGRFGEAEEAYRTLLTEIARSRAFMPTIRSAVRGEAAAHLNLGQVLAATGRRPAAREQYDQALRIDPGLGLAHFGRAWLDLEERGPGAALEDARRAAELEPGVARVQLLLADVLAALGRTDEAEVHRRRALDLDPERLRSRGQPPVPGRSPP